MKAIIHYDTGTYGNENDNAPQYRGNVAHDAYGRIELTIDYREKRAARVRTNAVKGCTLVLPRDVAALVAHALLAIGSSERCPTIQFEIDEDRSTSAK